MDLAKAQQIISDMNSHKINWDDNLRAAANNVIKASSGGGNNGGSGGGNVANFSDVLGNAQNLNNLFVQANQPAIQSLQGNIDPLKQRYQDLIDSIKGQGSVAQNQQTLATNNELARRGILPDSGVAQQQLAQALLPVSKQTQGAIANVGMGEQQDINSINNAIAQLQSGNPQSALEGALNILSTGQSTANLQQQIASQNAIAGSQLAAQLGIAGLENQYREIPYGGGLYNTATGSAVNSSGNFQLSTNSGGGGGYTYKTTGASSPASSTNTVYGPNLPTGLQKAAGATTTTSSPAAFTTPTATQVNLTKSLSGLPLNFNLSGIGNQLTTNNKQNNPNSFLGLSF